MNISQMNVVELAPCAVRTSTYTGTGVDLSAYSGPCHVILQSSAATAGTTPTLNVTLEQCATVGGTYSAITGGAFAEVDDTPDSTQMLTIKPDELLPFVRVLGTIAGTNTPTFGFGVVLVGCQQSGRNSSQSV